MEIYMEIYTVEMPQRLELDELSICIGGNSFIFTAYF
jgi:hypothetical protein